MISDHIQAIRGRIQDACRRAGRDPHEVTLVAVAKTFPAEAVRQTLESGTTDIGENYVQELLRKRGELPDQGIRWHFIGHLQSNKVKSIAGWVHMIHAVDSAGLAEEIDKRAGTAGRVIDCLLEVNTTGEKSKYGVEPDRVLPLVRTLEPLRNIRIAGLMTIGPFLPDPEGSRPMFRLLRELRDGVRGSGQSNAPVSHLSMGMTGDFEVAIEEGATLVRIGTAIFGSRKYTAPGENTP
jgi:pyridoxal phosphate enzyme (YggS family)